MSIGVNYLNDGVQKPIHAEVNVCQNAAQVSGPMTLLVIRTNRQKELRMSRPCYDCIQHMANYQQIDKVVYTGWDGKLVYTTLEELKNSPHQHHSRFTMWQDEQRERTLCQVYDFHELPFYGIKSIE